MPTVVSIGSAMLDRLYDVSTLPGPDGNTFANGESEAFGGVAANVAGGVERLGHDVGMIARLGTDAAADTIEAELDARGIDRVRVRRSEDPEERTAYSLVFRAPDGERMVVTCGDTAPNLRLDDEDLAYCRGADAVFANAYLPDPAARRFRSALTGGLPPVIYDLPGPVPELRDRGTDPDTVDRLVPAVDVFVASEGAARSYLGGGDPVEALRDRGCRRGAITRGADGATLFAAADRVHVPAFDVDAVDTTGAGDAFIAGLLHAWLLEGRPMREAGRFAAATAALNCTAPGAQGGLPTVEAVETFLEDRA